MKISIIGCGTIGTSLAQRLAQEHTLALYSPNHEKVKELADSINAVMVKDIREAVIDAEIVILAIKKHHLTKISEELNPILKDNQLIISVLAGASVKTLKGYFGKNPILRMMPNIAIVYGKGVIGLADIPDLKPKQRQMIEMLCKPLGTFYWIAEDKIDALTALTGSGPAFVFVMIEAMVEAAIALGFNAAQGQELVYQMLQGSLTMLQETKRHPADLKWSVASPEGTTIAGLHKMEEEKVRHGIIQAFLAAKARADQMHL